MNTKQQYKKAYQLARLIDQAMSKALHNPNRQEWHELSETFGTRGQWHPEFDVFDNDVSQAAKRSLRDLQQRWRYRPRNLDQMIADRAVDEAEYYGEKRDNELAEIGLAAHLGEVQHDLAWWGYSE